MNWIANPDLPAWLPGAVRLYLDHVEAGVPLRELARREGCHASTILRAVRRTERRRDDPLLDQALLSLKRQGDGACRMEPEMRMNPNAPTPAVDDHLLATEGLRVLRKLAEAHTVLAVATDMDRAAVLRDVPGGATQRLAVVDRAVAQAFAVKEWISCRSPGRVARYDITAVGRAALRRMQAQAGDRAGLGETAAPFAHQHRDMVLRPDPDAPGRHIRYNAAESPVSTLGRKRDKDGKPYLEADLIRAAERLREDFEAAQMGPRVAQNWDRFLTGGDRGVFDGAGHGPAMGPAAARARVAAALTDLGPGLGDVALRVCCYLEGLETFERKMGWAARSGKIVLRIALQRLVRHYDETYGRGGPRLG